MSRLNEVTALFYDTKSDVLDSIGNWQDYLTTASRLYKYSFDDQLMIYAQKPDATACANMEIWNKKMNRWVRRGSKGIALIRQNQGGKPRLEYVFDVADTNEVRGAKKPYLWEMNEEYHQDVLKQLTSLYGDITQDSFAESLMEFAERAVGEHYREFLHDLNYDLEDSFLEGLDELNVDVAFRKAVTASVQFMVLTRSGIDAREYLDDEDFRGINQFNTDAVLSHLGNAINIVSNEMLLAIGAVVRESERTLFSKALDNKQKVDYNKNIEFITLKCESDDLREEKENGKQGELHSERGLSHSELTDDGLGRFAGHSGQVRTDEGNTPQGTPQGYLQPNAARRQSMAAFGGSRPDGQVTGRTYDVGNDAGTGRDRGTESERPASLGAESQQYQAASGGSNQRTADLRKINQISLFPSIEQQIENIAVAKADEQSSAFSFAQNSFYDDEAISFDVVDKILATGSDERNTLSLIAGFMAFNTDIKENAEYLKNQYHRGGKGFDIDGERYSLWFDENGVQIARGRETYNARNKITLSWEQTAERIRNLLEKGEFTTPDKLAASKEVYQKYVADYLCYMYRDKEDNYHNAKLDEIEKTGSFPDYSQNALQFLQDKEKLSSVMQGLYEMEQDFIKDKDATMRLTFHTPTEIIGMAKDLQNEPVIFPSKENFQPIVPTFVTEDELNAIYATKYRKGNFQTSRIDTYAFFKQGHTAKEKADYLKNSFGWSGSGYQNTSINFSAKGVDYSRGGMMKPYARVIENWGQVAKRVDKLIAENRYISKEELDYIPTYEKQIIARKIYSFYSYAPSDVERPFTLNEDRFSSNEKPVKEIAEQLYDSEFVDNLLGQMEYVLSNTLSDERGFDTMQTAYNDLKDFQNGDYSIFNKQEYTIKPEEIDEDEPPEDTDDIGNIAKKLERKRKSAHKEDNSGQLTLDLVGGYSSEKTKEDTPVAMEQKAYTPLTLHQVGDFYELYGSDANIGAKELDLMLLYKTINGEKVDMVGFPKHSLEHYKSVLRVKGFDFIEDNELVENVVVEEVGNQLANEKMEELLANESTIKEYLSQKSDHPYQIVGIQSGSLLLFYGDDAEVVAPALGRKVIEREIPFVGNTKVTGGYADDFKTAAEKLKEKGINFCFIGEENGDYSTITEHFAKDYIPLGMELTIEGRDFVIDSVNYDFGNVSLRDASFQNGVGFPIFRSESVEYVRYFVEQKQAELQEQNISISEPSYNVGDKYTTDFGGKQNITITAIDDTYVHYTFDDLEQEPVPMPKNVFEKYIGTNIKVQQTEPQENINFDFDGGSLEDTPLTMTVKEQPKEIEDTSPKLNFKITNDDLGVGTAKEKFARNIEAIKTLKSLETESRRATAEEQEILSRYIGWGGLSEAFDDSKDNWHSEYTQLKDLLTADEYSMARASTLNAHYTSPTVIRAMYKALGNMNIPNGNILEPAMGTGNFFGMLPQSMANSKLYGVELDSLTGRIAKQLYQKANIQIKGFEKTDFSNDFFDVAVGNVPFGNYKLNDKKYDKQNLLIHDYFFSKSLDKVRSGGIVAFITSKGTLDKESSEVRKQLAQKADLLGAIRLPNNAFKANAGTEVTSDIIFFQKRDHAPERLPDWVELGETAEGVKVNKYFEDNPQMIMGEMKMVTGQFGMESTCVPNNETPLSEQLDRAITNILAPDMTLLKEPVTIAEGEQEQPTIEATPDVRNFSYTLVDDKLYYRENSRMKPIKLNKTAENRVKALLSIRDITREIIDMQLNECSNEELQKAQAELNTLYDRFNKKFGLINNKANRQAFADDVSYPLLCSLENLDERGELKSKADMFSKRTIKQSVRITAVDTPIEALAVSISEKAGVNIPFMADLLGGEKHISKMLEELKGVIFKDPLSDADNDLTGWQTADEYLSGNVREKLTLAKSLVEEYPQYQVNVDMLTKVQPKDLSAAEIDVRMGATWVDPEYYKQFLFELLGTPRYMQNYKIDIMYSKHTGEWNVKNKAEDRENPRAYATFGTKRKSAYQIFEDSLNLRDVRVFDTLIDDDGKEKRVLNGKETTLAQQKQEAICEAFKDWIWKDPQRREVLAKKYNTLYNSIRPREFDGQHIKFDGMNPLIKLNTHQSNAVARTLYGGNALLAHVVGAGKTFTMIASAMEGKRLGLQQKSLFVVPNHLTEQMGSDIHILYPGANVLVATKKDFEPANRKKFCSRIATGDFDIVVIGHSQFEKIPLSVARQEEILKTQVEEILLAIQDAKAQNSERYTVKQLEKTKKSLETRLEKLGSQERKDSVVTFEELGVDKLYVDEAHLFKNLFLQTKMRNVAGIGQSEAQKSTDMFTKCRYMDELTGGKGTVFATGTPVSNSMTELYTMMRYLQYGTLQQMDLIHFDSWAATFGEKVTAIELAPEGTGFRSKTRFAKFFNLPELINIWKEAADIQTADMLNLPVPEVIHTTVVTKPSDFQRDMVKDLADRADVVRKKLVEPNVDNMLKITSDGRKLALDQRLQNDMLNDDPDSKINVCVKNVYDIWEESTATKGAQLIFCDLSTPHYDGTFNVYDDIKNKLMERGVPPEEIKYIHDANTEQQKAELFARVRSGEVRVLIGSTGKMGAGTNVQKKLVALHHTDCPWRPADLEQREGRIVRQGNENKQVKIFKYVTENTFDAYNWSLIENKQKFIGQIFTSKSPARSADDIDATALSYAEVKALATGDERIKEKMDLDIQVAKLKLMRSNHQSQKYEMEDRLIKYYPTELKKTEERITGLVEDYKVVQAHPVAEDSFSMTIKGKVYTERKAAGEAIIQACKEFENPDDRVPLGEFRGFPLTLYMENRTFKVAMKNTLTHTAELENNITGNIVRINNALENMPRNIENLKIRLDSLKEEQQSAQSEVDTPFPKEQEYREKSDRLTQLNKELDNSESETEQPSEEQENSPEKKPSVLKALKDFKEEIKAEDTQKTAPEKSYEER